MSKFTALMAPDTSGCPHSWTKIFPARIESFFAATQVRPKDVDDPAIQYIALARNKSENRKFLLTSPPIYGTHTTAQTISSSHIQISLTMFNRLQIFVGIRGCVPKSLMSKIFTTNLITGFSMHAPSVNSWRIPTPIGNPRHQTYVLLVGDTHIDIKNEA